MASTVTCGYADSKYVCSFVDPEMIANEPFLLAGNSTLQAKTHVKCMHNYRVNVTLVRPIFSAPFDHSLNSPAAFVIATAHAT